MDAPKLFNRAGVEYPASGVSATGRPYRAYRPRCSRCGGKGGSEAWAYTGYTCYDCGGAGVGGTTTEPLYTAEKLAQLNAAAEKRAAKATEKRNAELAAAKAEADARRAAFEAGNAGLLAKLKELVASGGDFWPDLAQGIASRAMCSDRQAQVIEEGYDRLVARRAQEAAAKPFGEVGKRYRGVDLVVERNTYLGTVPGVWPARERWLVAMRTADGAPLVWFTGASAELGAAKADLTVKEQGEYRGVPQTTVQRVKFNEYNVVEV